MLTMAEAQYIKHLFDNEDMTKSEIAQKTGYSYHTVSKYAEKTDWNDRRVPTTKAENYPVLGPYISQIDEWLAEDRKVPRKQRHTAQRIFERLRDEKGYCGSYTSVKRYVRRKKRAMHQNRDGCIPLEHPKGEAQVDFGKFVYRDGEDEEHSGYALTISFPYSNIGFTQAFPSQNQECLFDGMKRIFEHIGGVPVRIRFDNMTTAVAEVLKDGERVLTDNFRRFMLHYRFQADFCNPASGNEKGNVENKVGYSRRNAFVPVPTIKSFDDFNAALWDWCDKDAERLHYKREVSIRSLWEEEKTELLILPEVPYEVFRYESLRVSKTGFVMLDTNRYGLSPELAGETIQAKIFCDKVEFYYDHTHVGTYRRSYGRNEELMDWTQYVRTLCRKPGAVEHSRFFPYMPKPWQDYLSGIKGSERREALQLLDDIVSDGNTELCVEILDAASRNGRSDTDSLRQYYYALFRDSESPTPLSLKESVPTLNYNPNLSAYDGLTAGGRNDG